ncbi:MAG: DUF2283 domain-containing protein [Alphaproteobacteria bacterium]|nr:DUF2283 domain-containing protein [Alphaproteobacteria bacterium]
MKITYDAEADAVTITLREAPVADSVEDHPGVVLDYDDQGGLVAIEILDARNRIDAIDTIQFHIGGKGPAASQAAE